MILLLCMLYCSYDYDKKVGCFWELNDHIVGLVTMLIDMVHRGLLMLLQSTSSLFASFS
jgi:hypothetical protein